MPIQGKDFPNTDKVNAVIQVCEDWELQSTLFTTVLNPVGDWKCTVTHISAPDFKPVPQPLLHQAADTIHDHFSKNWNIYIHCKAGRGRSAMCVLAYLIKHKNMNYDDALALVKKTRPQVNMNAAQQAGMLKFVNEVSDKT